MKFEYVQKIVERIRQDIICPRCGKKCNTEAIEVCGIENNTIDFQTDCTECDARVHIAAELNISSAVPTKARPKDHRVSVQKMQDLRTTLKNFNGDVKDLF